jgi:hypothetical protein
VKNIINIWVFTMIADCVLDLFLTSHSHWPLFYGFVVNK